MATMGGRGVLLLIRLKKVGRFYSRIGDRGVPLGGKRLPQYNNGTDGLKRSKPFIKLPKSSVSGHRLTWGKE